MESVPGHESRADGDAAPLGHTDPHPAVTEQDDETRASVLRRTVAIVVALNLAYFAVEIGIALAIRSVSLFADSVDFLEDTAINTLIFIALGWSLAQRARIGKIMAVIIVIPSLAGLVMTLIKVSELVAPDPPLMAWTAVGAIIVNAACAFLLSRFRHDAGSLTKAARLAARNDVIVNAAIILMALVTWRAIPNGWPDIILGVAILALNATSAKEIWEAATAEDLTARALAGDFDDD